MFEHFLVSQSCTPSSRLQRIPPSPPPHSPLVDPFLLEYLAYTATHILYLSTMISGVFSCLLFVFVVFPSVAFAQIRTGSRPASSYHHSTPNSPFVRGSPAQISAYLDAHNQVRAVNNAPPLTWSQPLADLAAIWADGCQFKSTGGLLRSQPYGENIVAATRYFPISAAVATFTQDQGECIHQLQLSLYSASEGMCCAEL